MTAKTRTALHDLKTAVEATEKLVSAADDLRVLGLNHIETNIRANARHALAEALVVHSALPHKTRAAAYGWNDRLRELQGRVQGGR